MDRQFFGLLWPEVIVLLALGSLGSEWHAPIEVRRKIQTAEQLRAQLNSPTIFKILLKLDQMGLVERQFNEHSGAGERLKYRLGTIGLQYYNDIRSLRAVGFFD